MTEAKTRITEVDPTDFISQVEPERKREEAMRLDTLFRKVTGEKPRMWGPTIIGYGVYSTTYESGREVTWLRTGFSPRKAKHSIYLMGGYCDSLAAERRDALLGQLGKYSSGKSCLYVNKLADIDLEVLEQLLRNDWDAMAQMYPG